MRIAAGHSQQTLAKSAGLGIATVVVLETQDKASARTIEKIGAVLGAQLEAP
jgi:DNA-binding XRE family transcriptional regulator